MKKVKEEAEENEEGEGRGGGKEEDEEKRRQWSITPSVSRARDLLQFIFVDM